jgi:hypothetical protein
MLDAGESLGNVGFIVVYREQDTHFRLGHVGRTNFLVGVLQECRI